MKLPINFRHEFNEFLRDYGYDVLLQRSGRKIRCRCWNEKYQEANPECPLCIGTGWVSRMERHTVRRKSAVQTISRPNLSQQTELGKMWIDAQTFYMHYDAHPKVGDYIYEVGWTPSKKPTHIIHVYRINDVFSNRGENGRIEYWTVSAKSETMNQEIQNILVRSIGPIQNYELVRRLKRGGRE